MTGFGVGDRLRRICRGDADRDRFFSRLLRLLLITSTLFEEVTKATAVGAEAVVTATEPVTDADTAGTVTLLFLEFTSNVDFDFVLMSDTCLSRRFLSCETLRRLFDTVLDLLLRRRSLELFDDELDEEDVDDDDDDEPDDDLESVDDELLDELERLEEELERRDRFLSRSRLFLAFSSSSESVTDRFFAIVHLI